MLRLLDQSTDELEKNLAEIEETNRKIRANLDKEKAEEEAKAISHNMTTLQIKLKMYVNKNMTY